MPSGGSPRPDAMTVAGIPWKIVQMPGLTILLFEEFHKYRQIHTDGRQLPVDVGQPAWYGYSIGRWEGDTFVVETTGFRPGHARVISLAALALDADGAVDRSVVSLLNPGVDPGPTHVHGLTAEMLADQPTFTVAGIIDRTAGGGHGSDTSLRASESLARDAATLKPDASAATPDASAANMDAKEEASLRADLARAPGGFDANHRLGEFCLRAGNYREAVRQLEAAFQIEPANGANEYDLALAQKAAGDYGAARVHAQNLLAHQNTAELHSLLGDLDEQTGDSLVAVREYELAVHLVPSEQNYFKWGAELLIHRAVDPAIEVFTRGSEAHPRSARMLAALGAALFAAGRYDEAAHRLCDASDLNPAESSPYVFLDKIDAIAPAPL